MTQRVSGMQVFDEMESEVRSYCRHFTEVFVKASNATMEDSGGKTYIDFSPGPARSITGTTIPAYAAGSSIICWKTASRTDWTWRRKRRHRFCGGSGTSF
ncbi:hypothetical protein PACILC2_43200 [Paenibacillus cisolokensis]|uniref:Hydantoinase B/oxoprolinase domain-containing protein n=1 Tax=Paenibacillus cisolokensis TaxID=1658519 RepID=A0ABQ4NC12_9BACL|nr:hypothetical protein PACILC2_43200 [Paenibacillus cisolokensis]